VTYPKKPSQYVEPINPLELRLSSIQTVNGWHRSRNRTRADKHRREQARIIRCRKAILAITRQLNNGDYEPRQEGDQREQEAARLFKIRQRLERSIHRPRPAKPEPLPRLGLRRKARLGILQPALAVQS
jgi:hypothetical protein